jgi:tetratricopeptide (TPR) repeat protein
MRERLLAACVEIHAGNVERGLAMLEEARAADARALTPSPSPSHSPEAPRFVAAGGGKSICDDTADQEVADFCEKVVANGVLSAPSLAALCRTILSLMCAGRVAASDAARRSYDAWVESAATELGDRACSELTALGKLLGHFDRRTDAARAFERAVALAKASGADTRALERELGIALVKATEHERAFEVLGSLRDSLDAGPGGSRSDGARDVRLLIADALSEIGRYDDARAAYDELATLLPEGRERTLALLGAAMSTHRGGSEPEGRALLFSLLEATDRSGALATEEGVRVAEELLGMLVAAEDDAAVTVQKTLRDATARAFGEDDARTLLEDHNVGCVLSDLRAFEEAEAIFRRVLARQDSHAGKSGRDALRTRRSLERLLMNAGRDEEAAELRHEIAQLAPGPPEYEPPRVHAVMLRVTT